MRKNWVSAFNYPSMDHSLPPRPKYFLPLELERMEQPCNMKMIWTISFFSLIADINLDWQCLRTQCVQRCKQSLNLCLPIMLRNHHKPPEFLQPTMLAQEHPKSLQLRLFWTSRFPFRLWTWSREARRPGWVEQFLKGCQWFVWRMFSILWTFLKKTCVMANLSLFKKFKSSWTGKCAMKQIDWKRLNIQLFILWDLNKNLGEAVTSRTNFGKRSLKINWFEWVLGFFRDMNLTQLVNEQ